MASNLLTELHVKSAKTLDKQYTLRDGRGLFVLVHPNGSKYFQLRTTLNGKSKLVALGVYPVLSLSEAREQTLATLKLIKQGIDPVLESKIAKQQRTGDSDNTFKKVAQDWLEVKRLTLAASTHLKIEQTFNANVYGQIGKYPIKTIDNIMVRNCLLTMQKRGALEFMEKTRGWIKQVFDFALADKLINENPIPLTDLRLKKHVGEKFPRLKNCNDAGILLRNLTEYQGTQEVQTCVTLMLHLSQRPSELREAKWDEFDLLKGIWTIPLEKSKTRKHMTKPHTVMLSKQAVALLEELSQYTGGGEYLFAARITGKPVSEATIRKAFRLCFTDYHIVPHGCRHFFSTQANESGLFRSEVIEEALSHSDTNKIRAVYNESSYDSERKELMQWWGDQLDQMRDGAKIINFQAVT